MGVHEAQVWRQSCHRKIATLARRVAARESVDEAWKIALGIALTNIRTENDEDSIRVMLGAIAIANISLGLDALVSHFDVSDVLDDATVWATLLQVTAASTNSTDSSPCVPGTV